MAVLTIVVPDEIKKQFDMLSDSFRLSKKELLVVAIMLFLWLSDKGIMAQLQNMALSHQKPMTDMILEFLKNKIGGK